MDNARHSSEYYEGQKDLLVYLITIAQETQGAKIWDKLFCEIRANIGENKAARLDSTNWKAYKGSAGHGDEPSPPQP